MTSGSGAHQASRSAPSRFEPDGEVDLLPQYAAPLPAVVIAEMIGLPADMAPQLLAWSNSMVKMYMFGVDEAVESEADRAAEEFVAYLTGVLAERRTEPQPDLVTHMLDAEIDGGRLSDAEVIATTILLLNAGHEATVHTTGNAVTTILRSGLDPSQLFAHDAQSDATVEECLRFDAPLHLFTRCALDDVELDSGLRLRRGEQIGIMLGAANRDPHRFDRPDDFDPGGATAATSASAPASTSASAHRPRGRSCRRRCGCSSSGCRPCASPASRSIATSSTSTAWTRSN